MKKKTVITTEKHEVWVIRSPADAITEEKPINNESDSGNDNLSPIDSDEQWSDADVEKE
jgi:hypothetical protein